MKEMINFKIIYLLILTSISQSSTLACQDQVINNPEFKLHSVTAYQVRFQCHSDAMVQLTHATETTMQTNVTQMEQKHHITCFKDYLYHKMLLTLYKEIFIIESRVGYKQFSCLEDSDQISFQNHKAMKWRDKWISFHNVYKKFEETHGEFIEVINKITSILEEKKVHKLDSDTPTHKCESKVNEVVDIWTKFKDSSNLEGWVNAKQINNIHLSDNIVKQRMYTYELRIFFQRLNSQYKTLKFMCYPLNQKKKDKLLYRQSQIQSNNSNLNKEKTNTKNFSVKIDKDNETLLEIEKNNEKELEAFGDNELANDEDMIASNSFDCGNSCDEMFKTTLPHSADVKELLEYGKKSQDKSGFNQLIYRQRQVHKHLKRIWYMTQVYQKWARISMKLCTSIIGQNKQLQSYIRQSLIKSLKNQYSLIYNCLNESQQQKINLSQWMQLIQKTESFVERERVSQYRQFFSSYTDFNILFKQQQSLLDWASEDIGICYHQINFLSSIKAIQKLNYKFSENEEKEQVKIFSQIQNIACDQSIKYLEYCDKFKGKSFKDYNESTIIPLNDKLLTTDILCVSGVLNCPTDFSSLKGDGKTRMCNLIDLSPEEQANLALKESLGLPEEQSEDCRFEWASDPKKNTPPDARFMSIVMNSNEVQACVNNKRLTLKDKPDAAQDHQKFIKNWNDSLYNESKNKYDQLKSKFTYDKVLNQSETTDGEQITNLGLARKQFHNFISQVEQKAPSFNTSDFETCALCGGGSIERFMCTKNDGYIYRADHRTRPLHGYAYFSKHESATDAKDIKCSDVVYQQVESTALKNAEGLQMVKVHDKPDYYLCYSSSVGAPIRKFDMTDQSACSKCTPFDDTSFIPLYSSINQTSDQPMVSINSSFQIPNTFGERDAALQLDSYVTQFKRFDEQEDTVELAHEPDDTSETINRPDIQDAANSVGWQLLDCVQKSSGDPKAILQDEPMDLANIITTAKAVKQRFNEIHKAEEEFTKKAKEEEKANKESSDPNPTETNHAPKVDENVEAVYPDMQEMMNDSRCIFSYGVTEKSSGVNECIYIKTKSADQPQIVQIRITKRMINLKGLKKVFYQDQFNNQQAVNVCRASSLSPGIQSKEDQENSKKLEPELWIEPSHLDELDINKTASILESKIPQYAKFDSKDCISRCDYNQQAILRNNGQSAKEINNQLWRFQGKYIQQKPNPKKSDKPKVDVV